MIQIVPASVTNAATSPTPAGLDPDRGGDIGTVAAEDLMPVEEEEEEEEEKEREADQEEREAVDKIIRLALQWAIIGSFSQSTRPGSFQVCGSSQVSGYRSVNAK